MGPTHGGRPAEPRRAIEPHPDRRPAGRGGADLRDRVRPLRPRQPRGSIVCRRRIGHQQPAIGAATPPWCAGGRRTADAAGQGLHPGGIRAHAHAPGRRSGGGREACDHRPGRVDLHQSGRLGQQGRRVLARAARRPRRRRAAAALGSLAGGSAHRVGTLGDEHVHASGPVGVGPRSSRPAPAAGRHGVRPVRAARSRCLHLLPLQRRPLHRGRHAVGDHAGS